MFGGNLVSTVIIAMDFSVTSSSVVVLLRCSSHLHLVLLGAIPLLCQRTSSSFLCRAGFFLFFFFSFCKSSYFW